MVMQQEILAARLKIELDKRLGVETEKRVNRIAQQKLDAESQRKFALILAAVSQT